MELSNRTQETTKQPEEEKDEEFRKKIRQMNTEAVPDLSERDCTINRITKFRNKVKRMAEADMPIILQEIRHLNLSMYVTELAQIIVDANFRLKDIFFIVELCTYLHIDYPDFTPTFVKALMKCFSTQDPITGMSKRRVLLRLFTELYLVNTCSKWNPLNTMMQNLCMTKSSVAMLQNISIIESFNKRYAPIFFSENSTAFAELRETLRSIQIDFFKKHHRRLQDELLAAVEEQNEINQQQRVNKGIVDAENDARHHQISSSYQKLVSNINNISDHLQIHLDTSVEEPLTTRESESQQPETASPNAAAVNPSEESRWEDENEKAFYEDVIDLRDCVPATLLGITLKTEKTGHQDKHSDPFTPKLAPKPVTLSEVDQPLGITLPMNSPSNPVQQQTSPTSKDPTSKDPTSKDPTINKESEKAAPEVQDDSKEERKSGPLESLINRLVHVINPDQVDQLAIFYFFEQINSSRTGRKKLVKTLLTSRRVDLHLLPLYSRFLATIAPFARDVKDGVVEGALQDFKDLVTERDPVKIESKIKAVRYLSELCKFRLVPPGVILDCINSCVEDLTHHHVEMAYHFLITCGRYVQYDSGAKSRFHNILDRLLRVTKSKNFPVRLDTMIEDAYDLMRPSAERRNEETDWPPMRQYIVTLISYELKLNLEQVIRKLRKLDWNDSQVINWLSLAILELESNVAYTNIWCLAELLLWLSKYHPDFVIATVDELLENIQLRSEKCDFRENPRRIREVKLLGELYNYRLVDSSVIFDFLYSLIGFSGPSQYLASSSRTPLFILQENANTHQRTTVGKFRTSCSSLYSISEENQAEEEARNIFALPLLLLHPLAYVESPKEYFSLKLVCVILDTCGSYFLKGSQRGKLERFLVFFDRFMLMKGEIPVRVKYFVQDTVEQLLPNRPKPISVENTEERIVELLQDELSQYETQEVSLSEEMPEADLLANAEKEDTGEEKSVTSDEACDGLDEEIEYEEYEDDLEESEFDQNMKERQFENDAFDTELNRIIVDSAEQARLHCSVTQQRTEFRFPPVDALKQGQKKTDQDYLPFKFVTRKGNKFGVRGIRIPKYSKISQVALKAEIKNLEEHQKLKEFVIDSVNRLKMEERESLEKMIQISYYEAPSNSSIRRGPRWESSHRQHERGINRRKDGS